MKILLSVFALLFITSCASDDAPPMADATAMDATVDGPVADGSSPDAMTMDAMTMDASAPDSSIPDASIPDVGIPDVSIPDVGVPDGGTPMLSCMEIQSVYDALIGPAAMRCSMPSSCQILDGHCGVGLGGCYYAVTTTVTQEALDEVARWWTANRCHIGAPVCDCGPRPSGARCDSGGCLPISS